MANTKLIGINIKTDLATSLEWLKGFLVAEGVSVVTTRKIMVAADELLGNIRKYAFDKVEMGSVDLYVALDSASVKIRIEDNGSEFNPFRQISPNLNLPLEETVPGGLGIFLTRELANSHTYSRSTNRNIVELIFLRQSENSND